jgi:hypothetical protein
MQFRWWLPTLSLAPSPPPCSCRSACPRTLGDCSSQRYKAIIATLKRLNIGNTRKWKVGVVLRIRRCLAVADLQYIHCHSRRGGVMHGCIAGSPCPSSRFQSEWRYRQPIIRNIPPAKNRLSATPEWRRHEYSRPEAEWLALCTRCVRKQWNISTSPPRPLSEQ